MPSLLRRMRALSCMKSLVVKCDVVWLLRYLQVIIRVLVDLQSNWMLMISAIFIPFACEPSHPLDQCPTYVSKSTFQTPNVCAAVQRPSDTSNIMWSCVCCRCLRCRLLLFCIVVAVCVFVFLFHYLICLRCLLTFVSSISFWTHVRCQVPLVPRPP